MKSGVRTLGIAESYQSDRSILAGVVTKVDRSVDGFGFESCTVGGTDATDAVIRLFEAIDRADISYMLIAGIAIAWYNLLDLSRIHASVDIPVCSVTFEESDGLTSTIENEFTGSALEKRMAIYRSLPDRYVHTTDDYDVYFRAIGVDIDEARDLLDAYSGTGGRPEPVRLARLAARAADQFVNSSPKRF